MLTKKGLILVFMFSLLTHMGVAGTLIYLPFQPSINNPVKNGERIIWTFVQSQVAPSLVGEYRSKQVNPFPRGKGKQIPLPQIGKMGGDEGEGEKAEGEKAEGEKDKWILYPVEDTRNPMSATGDDYVNNTQISEVRSQNVDCNDSHCGEGGTYVSNSAIDRIVIERGRDSKDSLKGFLEDVRREIERRKYYPAVARMNGIEGTVYISFHIGGDDKPGDISVDRSSGFKILDESAIRTLKSINQLSSVPEEMRELNITVPIAYRLVEEGKRKGSLEKKHMTGK